MGFDPDKQHRHSIRLQGYDYSQAGAYFVTIVTQHRACLFGDVVDRVMRLNAAGKIVRDEWLRTSQIRPNVELDAFFVMPNHIHGIIILNSDIDALRDASTDHVPTLERFGKPTSNTIPTIVRFFKSTTTKQINEFTDNPGNKIWQRNYFEHIIRDQNTLENIRQYILNNPINWAEDSENPLFK